MAFVHDADAVAQGEDFVEVVKDATDGKGAGVILDNMGAKYLQRNIDTLDAGVPVLSMHAPFETVAKLDCYMTFKGMKAIFSADGQA